MDLSGQVAVVTGGGRGIGRAVAQALAKRGARVVVADLDGDAACRVAEMIGGLGLACDVRSADEIAHVAGQAAERLGPVDLWCSNAGFATGEPAGPVSAPDETWQAAWDVHVMAHVHAARAVLPGMLDRGRGTLVNVASAAGLLCQIGDAAYSATKHAAVSLAQSLAIEHGDDGIHACVLCPQYVATPLLGYDDAGHTAPAHARVLRPEDVAQALMDGLAERRFLILPHPEVAGFARHRAADMDRWITGMRALRRKTLAAGGDPNDIATMHRLIT